jgi:hypothetical protein
MSDDQEKLKPPTERQRDAGDSTKPATSQKTASESISNEKQADRHAQNFESLSQNTKALGKHTIADQPFILHDSKTGETLYDASKRHAKVLDKVSSDTTEAGLKKNEADHPHLKAGERLLQMEQALHKDKSRTDNASDHSSVSHKIPSPELRPTHTSKQVVRRTETADAKTPGSERQGGELNHEKAREKTSTREVSDTTRGDHAGPIKQEFSAWIPDYKTIGMPGMIPRFLEVHMSPGDNIEIEKHYRKSLDRKDESTLSEFDRAKLKKLAICDVAIDKYQEALTKSELKDTQNMPDQVRGLMLAGAALQDGAALGATKAVFHKVIEGGAIGDLASGTAMGLAFGKVVATLAANVNPWTRLAAGALRTGGVAMAVAEVGKIGTDGWNGLMKSVPALEELSKHPSEKSFAAAKASIEENLGDPLADATLVGLGFAAAHGIEKAIPGGGKGGGRTHEGESRTGADPGDRVGKDQHAEPTSNREHHNNENRLEEQKHKDNLHESPKIAHSEYSCENKTEDYFRILKCGEHEERMIYRKGWFNSIPKGHVDTGSPIKVHVLTDSAQDLGKLQRALIPELMRDPVLTKHISQWKGQDPNMGFKGEAHPDVVAPSGVGQGAKGFTIYTATAEDAIIVQKRIDGILHGKGLSRTQEIQTGNTETCPGVSKRASICRDTFAQAVDQNGHPGPVIDEAVARNINSRYGLKPGERLQNEQLRDLEIRTGVLKGAITYGSDGRLMLKGFGGESGYHGGYYATEAGVDTSLGKLVERPALYSIYRACGFDPCDLAIIWKK